MLLEAQFGGIPDWYTINALWPRIGRPQKDSQETQGKGCPDMSHFERLHQHRPRPQHAPARGATRIYSLLRKMKERHTTPFFDDCV